MRRRHRLPALTGRRDRIARVSSLYAAWSRTAIVVPALLAGLLLTGCGGGDSTTGTSPTAATTTPNSNATAAAPDRAACHTQLATADTIARRARLLRLSLSDFQLRSNDMQEVVEEATHVCAPDVVKPLKASMLRLLAADEYLLACSPQQSCRTGKLRRLIGEVVALEKRATARFS
jgi:hypothetical protein